MSGLVQAIVCHQEHTLSCHMIQGTLCELLSGCGDHRGRFSACNYSMRLDRFITHVIQLDNMATYVSAIIVIVAYYFLSSYILAPSIADEEVVRRRRGSKSSVPSGGRRRSATSDTSM